MLLDELADNLDELWRVYTANIDLFQDQEGEMLMEALSNLFDMIIKLIEEYRDLYVQN